MTYLVILSLQTSLLYMLFYGMTTSVDKLGLSSINMNGIFLGLSQAFGFMIVMPFTHRMRRVLWIKIFNVAFIVVALILFLLSFMEETIIVTNLRIFFSMVSASVMSSCFPILYTYMAELFPVEIRGLSSAIIIFIGKISGPLALLITTLCNNMKIHVISGLSIFVIVCLPLSFFLKETLVIEEEDKAGDRVLHRVSDMEEKLVIDEDDDKNAK